jgi:hypothetical protein
MHTSYNPLSALTYKVLNPGIWVDDSSPIEWIQNDSQYTISVRKTIEVTEDPAAVTVIDG